MGTLADGGAEHALTLPAAAAGQRLDKAVSGAVAAAGLALSRSRVAGLIEAGHLRAPDGTLLTEPGRKVKSETHLLLTLPPPADPVPRPEAIPLAVVHEDDDLIVVDKPAGMVVHPAPGAATGTLVNALLAHCGDLPGIGGERRPGIVHRIDKDTSGLLVVAKSEGAMTGLAAQFAAHTIHRRYLALAWGAPDRAEPRLRGVTGVSFDPDGALRIETGLGRDARDRKRMAVTAGGRRAVTRLRALERFGTPPFVSLIECRLETGRTHQIRVHAAHVGHSLVGDPVYGRQRALGNRVPTALADALAAFPRQALHAAELGFRHPVSDRDMHFCAESPDDLHALLRELRRNR